MLLKKHPVSSIAALSALLFAQSALAADSLTEALTGGKANVDIRYRYEDVNTATPSKAEAHTVRARVGYTTDTFNGFGAMVEMESTKELNNQYNSTNPANAAHATVLDPSITEVNQAYLSYSGVADTTVKWGRQRITLDNHRFIGNVGWRQNEQTFDALTLVNKSLPDTTITAGYLTNANRVIGDVAGAANAKMESPILNINYKGLGFAELSGYYYELDYTPVGGATTNVNSVDTYGIRLNGNTDMGGNKLLYTAELARQTEGNNNTIDFEADYALLEVGVDVPDIAVFKVGYELLGNDTGAITKATGLAAATPRSFSTPLATLHAFNGWTDMFLATPNQGLEDIYVTVSTKVAGINLSANYHEYSADKTTATATADDLGNEFGIMATYTFEKHYTVGLKYSEYSTGDTGSPVDTEKTWLWGEFKF